VIHTVGELAVHLEPAVVDDRLHGLVVTHDLGGEAGDAVPLGDGHHMLEDEGADTPVLPVVADHKGDLGSVALLIEVLASDGDDLVAGGLRPSRSRKATRTCLRG